MRTDKCPLFLIAMWSAITPPIAMAADAEIGTWHIEGQVAGTGLVRAVVNYEKDFAGFPLGFYVTGVRETGGYSEAYAGPTWKLYSWLKLGIGAGRETVSGERSSPRRNAFFDANLGGMNVYGTFERGGSGSWHKVTAIYNVSERFGVGVMNETGLGNGPRLEYSFPKRDTSVWGALLHSRHTGKLTPTIGVNVNF